MVIRRKPSTQEKASAKGKQSAQGGRPSTQGKETQGKESSPKVEFTNDRRLTVSVGTSSEFGQVKVGLSLSQNVSEKDDYLKLSDEIFDELSNKLAEHFDKLSEQFGDDPDRGGDDGGDDGDDFDNDDSDGGDDFGDDDPDDLTEDMIRKMKKDEVLALIKKEKADVNPKDYKKLDDLKEAVIDALFEEEGDDGDGFGDEDFGDDDFGDE